MKKIVFTVLMTLLLQPSVYAQRVYHMKDYGIKPGSRTSISARVRKAIDKIRKEANGQPFVLSFEKGHYHFYPEGSFVRQYFISNHDQTESKRVGIALEGLKGVALEGNGSTFIFHGIMLPVSVVGASHCTLQNFSIDFENPQIAQLKILDRDDKKGTTFQTAPWVKSRISEHGTLEVFGHEWSVRPEVGIAFEEKTRHVVYRTSDIGVNTSGLKRLDENVYQAPNWNDLRLPVGTVVAARDYGRPAPGIFVSHSLNTNLTNIKVHYAYGMGLLAQMSENIRLDGFSVCLKGTDDSRYFTTQADATHFSGCKGLVSSVNGLYEGMMDDAINVHGTYLKIVKKLDDTTYIGRYMHPQAWGFDWGFKGDSVQFVKSNTMEIVDGVYSIQSIVPFDKPTVAGAKEFKIKFSTPVQGVDLSTASYGIENLTWTPEVYFANNVIRNNRARGSLFSTPRKTIVERNTFDHTSGTAILLCGDCNGWYETGACRDVLIRNNKFVNALTNMFQFTNAVISIYPEIPDLKNQVKYFHGGKKGAITIVDNEFEMFDSPVLYAKSVDGIIFRNNTIKKNNDYVPFHWNQSRFLLERVSNVEIQ